MLALVLLFSPGFADAGSPAFQIAKIVELGTPYAPGARELNLFDIRRVQGKYTLYTLPKGNLANRKSGVDAAASDTYDRAFKSLDAFLVSLLDLDVDSHRVAGAECRQILAHLLLFDFLN